MCRFTVIGITDSGEISFDQSLLRGAAAYSGGRRHHAIVSRVIPPDVRWIDITAPLADVFDAYRSLKGNIVVFASGDPLFYGFASTLKREFPDAEIRVYPTFNSMQMLAHRLTLPYQAMRAVSLTGRPWRELDNALIRQEALIGVLTDRTHTPASIAAHMIEYGYTNYTMSVGENLGNRELEQVTTLSLAEATSRQWQMPNCVILRKTADRQRYLGIPEQLFTHLDGRTGMITKAPIRLISLSMLDLTAATEMWDVGFCTGSVSIEARLLFPDVDITAFERRPECREIMQTNSHRFGAPGINTVIADFMDLDLTAYPRPDAIFIGGHGGRLPEMIHRLAPLLPPDGCIVFNSVSPCSSEMFVEAVANEGLTLQASHNITLDNHNPITIFKAIKCPQTIS
ncbi:MAG: precorrin-6y C5,15-methyltransferase (decarboxylating) subunit CbiE [Muribaculaceae bacterium]|nr:precorrin-6y C5,15-methyltransferase (decarboxylating) subunit CbiE [Muribaculaceae bacterium]